MLVPRPVIVQKTRKTCRMTEAFPTRGAGVDNNKKEALL